MNKFRMAAIAAAIVAIAGGTYFFMKSNAKNRVLRVAFPSTAPASSYEPTKIVWDYQYVFLENIYSPLVEMDRDGKLLPGVAEHAKWVGNELQLTIRSGFKTEDGTPITAADVVFSLKRLLILSGNTHGNFKDLVCPGVELKSISDNCPGLTYHGNVVVIKTTKPEPFLLPMLAALDFAVIPRASTDPKTLKIVNYKETSGPYYVAKDDDRGHIELKLNRYSYQARPDIPQTVELVPEMTPKASLDALLDDKVDFITTVDSARAEEVIPFSEKHPQFRLFATMNIHEIFLAFTERALKELSIENRRYIAKRVREAFLEIYKNVPGYIPADTFFPAFSDGGIDVAAQSEISNLDALSGTSPNRKVKIGLIRRGDLGFWANPIQHFLPEANCYSETNVPDFKKYASIDEMPDAFIATTDTTFMEDINLITYSLNAGLFGMTKTERAKWLKQYMSIDDKAERLAMLRKLQFNALASPVLVPLVISPYTALIRKPWQIKLSTKYANDPLWQIRLD